ncbi:unnamed protein product [Cyclocybe aegerita]|uniref:Uncharacterized protein n=1 Tax=Cyclocybe aegerita TaxID=1973307 RepID=A0A8S0VTW9_CYCAE|nr:unnamed protein product [Cyclocybe aegerita]
MPAPGRGSKRKAKGKRRTESASTEVDADFDSIHVPQINNSEGWNAIADNLCTFFGLPDLTTRSGLKEIHANFDVLFARIDKVFSENPDDFRIRGGIVGIYTRMCVDAILRNKLFEKGVLEKILPLLDIDETRHLALRCLTVITRHGGIDARLDIAKHARKLTKLVRDLPNDDIVTELCVKILSHSVSVVVEGVEGPLHPEALRALDMTDVLKAMLETIKRPSRDPRHLVEHALDLIVMSTLYKSDAFKVYPSSIGFLVAGVRCKDWGTRGICLNALMRLYQDEHDKENRKFDPMRLFTEVRQGKAPSFLNDVLNRHGPARSDVYQTLSCITEFQKAMFAVAQDRDF